MDTPKTDEIYTKNQKEHLSDWLRDAYAMEHQSIELFEKEVDRMKDYPELRSKISDHLQDIKPQAGMLEQCLKSLGEDTSVIKTGLAKLVGTAQALTGLFVSDEIVKASVALYVFQHYKIANYNVLLEASNEVGASDIANTCGQILKTEEAMAEWMRNYIPNATQQFIREAI